MNNELNALTQQLYAQGYTRDDHPDTVCWGDWQNFCYKWETMLQFTWETPCGLLIQGESNVGRDVAVSECFYRHIWYCPENDNPLFRCPYQRKSCEHIPLGFPLVMCPCHRTDRVYDYACSMEKVMAEHNREALKQYVELTGGSYCACVAGSNGYDGGYYEVKYDVMNCIRQGCKNPVCVIRKQPRDLKKANIFCDVRRTWITRLGFLEEKRVEVTKGLKVFDRAVVQTDAEIWLKMKGHEASPLNNYAVIEQPKITSEDRRQEYFSKMRRRYGDQYDCFEFRYEVENIRIARSGQRDLLQDLRDAAEGIEVIHAADSLKAAKAQKRARREAAKAQRIRKVEKMILTCGWDHLEDKQFCERQQAAYTAALHGFQELAFFWEDMLSAQKALLGKPDSPPQAYNHYLIPDGDDGPKITIQRLRVQIDTLHRRFIQRLAGYFRSVYNITVEEKKIISELLLPKPPKSKKQALKEYLLSGSLLLIPK